MSWWGAYSLCVLASPLVLVVLWTLSDRRKRGRRCPTAASPPGWSVEAIQQRIARERADAANANAPTEAFPVTQVPDNVSTDRMPGVMPKGPRPYVQWPYLRRQFESPAAEVVGQVLDELRNLPDASPRWPDSDPDT